MEIPAGWQDFFIVIMTSKTIIITYLIFFAVDFLFRVVLSLLNILEVKKNRKSIPSLFIHYVEYSEYLKASDYTVKKETFSIISGVFNSIVLLVVILSGSFNWLDNTISGYISRPYIAGVVFVLAVSLFFYITGIPFAIYSQFRIEQKYGFNKMTLKLFFRDQLKALVISGILFSLVLLALFWFMDKSGSLWWIIASVMFLAFQVLLSIVYPLFIAPLFNKFSPLEEDELKESLKNLAEKLDFRTRGIYIMDGSKRSGHSNAYFTGVGGAKRIVLFDTLLSILSIDQISAVLAHEIAHYKKHHIIKSMILSFLFITSGFFIISLLLNYVPLFTAFGFGRISMHGILVILAFASGPFTFFLTPLFTMWSRKHEYEADAFTVSNTHYGNDLKDGLMILSKENLSNLTPHPLYSFFHYSHPTVGERARAIDSELNLKNAKNIKD